MATSTSTKLSLTSRPAAHSRENRRLRRSGQVPGVLYGKGGEPVGFSVGERDLRHALAASGAVLELSIDGSTTESAVLKDAHRHPVRGDFIHVDFLRVDLNQPIQTAVSVSLVGGEEAPGVVDGGVLSSPITELAVEALPNDIPDAIEVDVSGMAAGDTLLLEAVTAPQGVTFLDDPQETVVATITAPTPVETEDADEVEAETEVVGEGAGEEEPEGDDAPEVPAEDGGE